MDSSEHHEATLIQALAWVDVHRKQVIAAVVVAALAGLGWAIMKYNREQAEVAASRSLLDLRPPPAPQGAVPASVPADSYLKVAGAHGGTAAGEHALLLAAAQLFSEGRYADAEAQFSKHLQLYADSPLTPQSAFGVAASLDAQNKTADALKRYEEVSLRFPNDPVNTQAKLALARLYEAQGTPAKAYRIYEELMPKTQDEMTRPRWYQSQVMTSMGKLTEKHPELVPTNAPVAAASPQTQLDAAIKQALTQKAASSVPALPAGTNPAPGKR